MSHCSGSNHTVSSRQSDLRLMEKKCLICLFFHFDCSSSRGLRRSVYLCGCMPGRGGVCVCGWMLLSVWRRQLCVCVGGGWVSVKMSDYISIFSLRADTNHFEIITIITWKKYKTICSPSSSFLLSF